ncbi:MAG: AAA family ATPase [Candidatus Woesearchaeota archaeon]
MKFIGRIEELNALQKKYQSQSKELIIIYGRRRLGKTFLIKESLKSNTNSMYFLLNEESVELNVKRFSKELSQTLNNPVLSAIEATSFIEYFKLIHKTLPKNFIITFDEFSYLVEKNKSIISQFQIIYDEYFNDNLLKLVLCGSSRKIMSDLLSYQSALYGRRTLSIQLQEFSICESIEFLKEIKDLETIFKFYNLFGGVPYYLEKINQKLTFEENIKELYFSPTSFFKDEISFLLKSEFKEISNYYSIMKSISLGKNTLKEIHEKTLLDKSLLSKYITVLENLGFITSKKSFFDKENSKKSMYQNLDPFVNSWFAIFEEFKSNLENINVQHHLLKNVIPQIMGKLFEITCEKILFKNYMELKPYYRKGVEIDFIGKIDNKKLDVIECKFKKNVEEEKIRKQIEEKIQVLPTQFTYNCIVVSIDGTIGLKELVKSAKTKKILSEI